MARTVDITLEKAKTTAGGKLKGCVILNIQNDCSGVCGLELRFCGVEKTEVVWEEKTGHRGTEKVETRRLAHSDRTLVDQKVLLGDGSFIKDQGHVDSGRYEFPFEMQIPSHLPGAMHKVHAGRGWCKIEYVLEATLRHSHHTDKVAAKCIKLVAKPRKETPTPPKTQVLPSVSVHNFTNLRLRFAGGQSRGRLSLGVALETAQLSPGSQCGIRISLRNYSNIRLKHVQARLIQSVAWKAHGCVGGTTQSSRKREKFDAVDFSATTLQNIGRPQGRRVSHAHVKKELKTMFHEIETGSHTVVLTLPSGILDSYRSSALIQVTHHIQIKVKTPLSISEPIVTIPVDIGQPSCDQHSPERVNWNECLCLSQSPAKASDCRTKQTRV